MSDRYAYEADARHQARRLRREAEADLRAYELRVHVREQRRAALASVTHRIVHAFERLVGHLTRRPSVVVSRDSLGA
jgi:hypothetical protein